MVVSYHLQAYYWWLSKLQNKKKDTHCSMADGTLQKQTEKEGFFFQILIEQIQKTKCEGNFIWSNDPLWFDCMPNLSSFDSTRIIYGQKTKKIETKSARFQKSLIGKTLKCVVLLLKVLFWRQQKLFFFPIQGKTGLLKHQSSVNTIFFLSTLNKTQENVISFSLFFNTSKNSQDKLESVFVA